LSLVVCALYFIQIALSDYVVQPLFFRPVVSHSLRKKIKNVRGKYSSGVRFFVVAPAPCAGCVVSCTIDRRGQHCVGGDTPQATGQSGMNTLSYSQGSSHVAFTRSIHTWHYRDVATWHSHVSSTRAIHTWHPSIHIIDTWPFHCALRGRRHSTGD
jgi:hypothetical protein